MHAAIAALLVFAVPLMGAPVLRLSNSAVVVQGSLGVNAQPQTINASNIGDGTLALSTAIAPGASWLTGATVQGTAIQLTFNTASLARGTYTAEVTVSDPNAIDAPQVMTVTAIVGSRPPYVVDQYLPPGASRDVYFTPGFAANCTPSFVYACVPGLKASTQSGGQWLSVSVFNETTIADFWTAYMHLAPAATMAEGAYTGSIAISGSADDHAIPVTMNVTTQPIAVPSTAQISLRLAQGGPAATAPFLAPITLSNSGMGTLVVQSITASGTAVSAYNDAGAAVVTINPGSLAPGIYNDGLVTIQCNAANCPVQVPVSLQVIPRGPPVAAFQGVVNNATFYPGAVAPGDIAALFGEQLSLSAPASASDLPLPATLGGATVLVNDVEAPLYYTSFGQIAFQVPSSIAPGTAIVQVLRDGQPGNRVTVNVAALAPQIVVVTDANYNIRDLSHPTKPGESLILWCIGLGPTQPAVPDGTPAPSAEPLARITSGIQVAGFGYPPLTPDFAGLAPGEAGVYQVNLTVPANAPKGNALVEVVTGSVSSSFVTIAVQ